MKKAARADILELINDYCREMDEKGLLNVLIMARSCWKEAKRQEGTAEASEAFRADSGKIIYLFGRDQSEQ